ncbi:IclR family transcriptional regulator [Thermodesulfobacteriota bacterium]
MGNRYLAPSVKKAFDILKAVSLSREGMGLNEIARTLNIAKSTAHGITSILEELGAVKRDPSTKRYELGLTLFELGRRAYSQIDLRELARPVLETLMEKVQETVFLGTLNGEHVTMLDVIECRHDFKITSPIGTTIPLFAAATGKALLAVMDEDEAAEIIKTNRLPRHTDKSITDPERFLEEIREVKRKGYATDYEEYISGVRAVAAPINGERNRLAAIWIVGFKASLNENKMRVLKEEIIEAVDAINRRIREQSKLQT